MKISEAEKLLRAARARAAFLRPYFDRALYALVMVERPDCRTVGVDKWRRLYFNPSFVLSMTVEQLVPILLHEIGHLLRRHHERAFALGVTAASQTLANVAMDAEINDDLREDILLNRDMPALPVGAIYPALLGQPDFQTWEQYYLSTLDNAGVMAKIGTISDVVGDGTDDTGGSGSGSGKGSASGGSGTGKRGSKGKIRCDCGSGAHGVPRPWEFDGPGADEQRHEGLEDADWADIERDTARQIAAAAKQGESVGDWAEWASKIIKPKRIPWDRVLASGLRQAISHTAGYCYHTYSRPSRRSSAFPNVIMPSMRKPKPSICIVGDTSMSMSDKDLALVVGVVEDVCRALGTAVTFLSCDTQAHKEQQTTGRRIELQGRGGTDMRAGIERAMSLRPRPDTIVVVTDCDTPWPSRSPGVRTVVCGVSADKHSKSVPKWATYIPVVPAETSSRKRAI